MPGMLGTNLHLRSAVALVQMMDCFHEITTCVDDYETADSLDMASLRLERIPHDQRDIPWPPVSSRIEYGVDPVEPVNGMPMLVQVQHYWKSPNNTHSIPFMIVMVHNELYKDVEGRLRDMLNVKDEEWARMKCGIKGQFDADVTNFDDIFNHDVVLRDSRVDISEVEKDSFRVFIEHQPKRRRAKRAFDGAVKILN
jgi:hypothetical protein